MDTKYVISQLITAVITIVTTLIVVRLSLKGNLGISPTFKTKLKSTARRYVDLGSDLIAMVLLGILYYGMFRHHSSDLVTRLDALLIAGLAVATLVIIFQTILRLVGMAKTKPPPPDA